jgi:hypothetical protein
VWRGEEDIKSNACIRAAVGQSKPIANVDAALQTYRDSLSLRVPTIYGMKFSDFQLAGGVEQKGYARAIEEEVG